MANREPQTIEQAKLLTPAQVAAELNISLSAVYNLIRSGDLRAVDLAPSNRTGKHRFWRITRECLDEFLARRLMSARRPAPAPPKSVLRIPGYPDGVPNLLGI